MAAVAEATLFMNPRRFVVVLLLSISHEVFEETAISYFDAEDGTTKAYDDGARIARAANATERKEVVLVMVVILGKTGRDREPAEKMTSPTKHDEEELLLLLKLHQSFRHSKLQHRIAESTQQPHQQRKLLHQWPGQLSCITSSSRRCHRNTNQSQCIDG